MGTMELLLSLTWCHLLCIFPTVMSLNNGLALTPPMGWLSWERFECNTDCRVDPDNCIGEKLLMQMADAMVSEGYKDVGYEYINVDDCWPADQRDEQGKIQPDPTRFPSGFKKLADYIHSKGLKFGIYEDVGRHTCAGLPGTIGHYDLDAQTFADWGIDMLKFDGCNADLDQINAGYPAMGQALNRTGRKILYSCEWPLYARAKGVKRPDYQQVADTCNTWRVYGDINDAWQSMTSIMDWYGDNPGNFSEVAGPGNWNDADMVVVGDYGLSYDQERTQFGMWAMFASPLLLSVDLRNVRPESKALLQNKRVIAINQDPLGIPAKRVLQFTSDHPESPNAGKYNVWTRPVLPQGSVAIATVYEYPPYNSAPVWTVSINLTHIGLTNQNGYDISEVFNGSIVGYFRPTQNITFSVNPFGTVLYKAVPRSRETSKVQHQATKDNKVHGIKKGMGKGSYLKEFFKMYSIRESVKISRMKSQHRNYLDVEFEKDTVEMNKIL